jgi:hypothetical protein
LRGPPCWRRWAPASPLRSRPCTFPMPSGLLLLTYVTLQRLAELVIARRNTRALLAGGAYEAGAAHYPAMIALHATWLLTLWAFGWSHTLVPGYLLLVAVLQIGRYWVQRTLGVRWTTRIIMTPWAQPVTSGPFRFVRYFARARTALARTGVWRAQSRHDRVAHPVGERGLRPDDRAVAERLIAIARTCTRSAGLRRLSTFSRPSGDCRRQSSFNPTWQESQMPLATLKVEDQEQLVFQKGLTASRYTA